MRTRMILSLFLVAFWIFAWWVKADPGLVLVATPAFLFVIMTESKA
ncbi:MAG: hypothetical protein KC910_06660 [Candidatus Eremiobacteraeota bacterium]|nr:hypothetical protein [Candidatus Eremiobacteraeota bacterium]